jgi:hypothetical protein
LHEEIKFIKAIYKKDSLLEAIREFKEYFDLEIKEDSSYYLLSILKIKSNDDAIVNASKNESKDESIIDEIKNYILFDSISG